MNPRIQDAWSVFHSRKFVFLLLMFICFLNLALMPKNIIHDAFEVVESRGYQLQDWGRELAGKANFGQQEKKKIRIFCLVNTCPAYFETRAKAVMETWAKRCDYLYFITTQPNNTRNYSTIIYDHKEGYEKSLGKMKKGLTFAYENFKDKVDWFFKADDDCYLIMDNLKSFLEDKDTNVPIWYGRNFAYIVAQGYMSGGPGYVFSKAGLKILVEQGFTNGSKCNFGEEGPEDVLFGDCFEKLGVPLGDTYYEDGETFHPNPPLNTLNIDNTSWLQAYSKHKPIYGMSCCSRKTISFHYVTPEMMNFLEFLLYKLRVYKIEDDVIPDPRPYQEITTTTTMAPT